VLEPLKSFCQDCGKLYLKQITFQDLAEFRATWKDQALSASEKLERLRGAVLRLHALDQGESGSQPQATEGFTIRNRAIHA
jgi:hypothetical protein